MSVLAQMSTRDVLEELLSQRISCCSTVRWAPISSPASRRSKIPHPANAKVTLGSDGPALDIVGGDGGKALELLDDLAQELFIFLGQFCAATSAARRLRLRMSYHGPAIKPTAPGS